jgi:hypothetical protein
MMTRGPAGTGRADAVSDDDAGLGLPRPELAAAGDTAAGDVAAGDVTAGDVTAGADELDGALDRAVIGLLALHAPSRPTLPIARATGTNLFTVLQNCAPGLSSWPHPCPGGLMTFTTFSFRCTVQIQRATSVAGDAVSWSARTAGCGAQGERGHWGGGNTDLRCYVSIVDTATCIASPITPAPCGRTWPTATSIPSRATLCMASRIALA